MRRRNLDTYSVSDIWLFHYERIFSHWQLIHPPKTDGASEMKDKECEQRGDWNPPGW